MIVHQSLYVIRNSTKNSVTTCLSHRFPFYIKGKVQPRTDHEGPEGEYMYSYTLSLTSELVNATPWPLYPLERD